MKKTTAHFIQKRLLWCLILVLACLIKQDAKAVIPGIQAEFLKNSTTLSPSELASNVMKVKNNTGKSVRFHMEFSLPGGWEVLGNARKEHEILSNDSAFLPIRIIPGKDIKGGTSYVITVTMLSENNIQFAAQNWYVSLPVFTKWTANLPIKHQFFYSSHDSSGVELLLQNNGNADEELRISLVPDRRLDVLRTQDGGAGILSFIIKLPAGTDTLLTFPVIRKPSANSNKSRDGDLYRTASKENYAFQILVKSITSGGSWSGTMQFTKAGSVAKQNEFGRSALPLTVEANVYDVLTSGTTMSLDAYGNVDLSPTQLLTYRFQTVFISNYFNENSLLGTNNYIGYFDDHITLELGEVNGWGRSLLTGRGIKGSYRYGKNTVGAMTTRTPGFFKNYTSEGYGFFHNFRQNNLNITSQYSTNTNSALNINNSIINSLGSYKINPRNQITLGGGYSNEKSRFASTTGYGYELNYSFSLRNINISLGNNFGSSNYVIARGVRMYYTRTTYTKSSRLSYSLTTQNFSQQPSYFYNGVIRTGSFTRSDRYEGRIGFNSPSSFVAIKPTYLWEENQNLRIATRLIGVEYNAKNLTGVRFSSMGSLGYARAVDYNLSDFFVSRIGAYARWEKLYLNLRYTYGPVDAAEQARFVKDQINPQTVHLSSSYDYWMAKNKLLLFTTANLMYETYFKKTNFRLRPELFYYAKSGLRFSIYASFFSNSQKANPMYDEQVGREPYDQTATTEMNLGFGVRKQFGIPVPGKKYVTMHAVIFKDLNGNHKQDNNEEGVENMLVTIKTKSVFGETTDTTQTKKQTIEEFITGTKGDLTYENIPAGVYEFKCVSLVPNGEWFSGAENEYKIDSKQTIYIPMTRGVRITGSVMVERDKYSEYTGELDLSRVRVTAVDSTGKSYSVLTERNGSFLLNLPTGQYILSINEAALGENYIFTQNKVSLDLSTNFENLSVTFNAVEKKRKMEIKKFNSKE